MLTETSCEKLNFIDEAPSAEQLVRFIQDEHVYPDPPMIVFKVRERVITEEAVTLLDPRKIRVSLISAGRDVVTKNWLVNGRYSNKDAHGELAAARLDYRTLGHYRPGYKGEINILSTYRLVSDPEDMTFVLG